MAQTHGWPEGRARRIGERVKTLRGKRSAQWLADRCAELGHPISRSAIAKLENGRREDVTSSEVRIYAAALGVPPLLLEFPLGHVEKVEPLPGVVTDPWSAIQWFIGQRELPGLEKFSADDYGTLRMFEQHAREVDSILQRVAECDRLRRDIADHGEEARINLAGQLAQMERQARDLEASLREGREEMRRYGLIPPELPPPLRYLDEEPTL